jgi:hypothetical protein
MVKEYTDEEYLSKETEFPIKGYITLEFRSSIQNILYPDYCSKEGYDEDLEKFSNVEGQKVVQSEWLDEAMSEDDLMARLPKAGSKRQVK